MLLPNPADRAGPSGPAASARLAARRLAPPTSATAASRWTRRDTPRADRATGLQCAAPTESPANMRGCWPTVGRVHRYAAWVRETMAPTTPTAVRSTTPFASSYKKLTTRPASNVSRSLEAVPIYATSSRNHAKSVRVSTEFRNASLFDLGSHLAMLAGRRRV